jgi:hypothetical protein
VLLIGLLIAYFVLVEPAQREARYEKVQVSMTTEQVRAALGPPRAEYTRAALGSGIGEHAVPSDSGEWEPGHPDQWVRDHAHVVWHYSQAVVVFGKDRRVLAKSGLFCFD